MKRILLVATIAVLFAACVKEESSEIYYDNSHTRAGSYAYAIAVNETKQVVEHCVVAVVVERWAALTTDSARYAFEDRYLPTLKVRNTDSVVKLNSGLKTIYTVRRDGTPFAAGALRVVSGDSIRVVSDSVFAISYVGALPVPYNSMAKSTIRLTCRIADDSTATVSGKVVFDDSSLRVEANITAMRMRIKQAVADRIVYAGRQMTVIGGRTVLSVKSSKADSADAVNVEASDGHYDVTCFGHTERWWGDNYLSPYYDWYSGNLVE